jgi:hypothetical protein
LKVKIYLAEQKTLCDFEIFLEIALIEALKFNRGSKQYTKNLITYRTVEELAHLIGEIRLISKGPRLIVV